MKSYIAEEIDKEYKIKKSYIDRMDKFKKEHCKRCKNKTTDLCEIRVFAMNNIVYTKCGYFEVEDEINTISQ